jgi:putative endonuclease
VRIFDDSRRSGQERMAARVHSATGRTDSKTAFFVYVLGCRSATHRLTYVGWTTDPGRRLDEHNAGSGARFTRGRTWVLLHCERHASMRAAMSREWHLKRDRAFRRRLRQAMADAVAS